jgi:hypothetical protein
MNRIVFTIALLTAGAANLHSFPARPLSTDEKIQAADVIVVGFATAQEEPTRSAGGEVPPKPDNGLARRILRIEVRDVLWPPSATNTQVLILRHSQIGNLPDAPLPDECLTYTNAPGVFFIVRSKTSKRGEWVLAANAGLDWLEPATNALAVMLLIESQKGKPSSARALRVPDVPYPQSTPYDHDSKMRMVYLTAFRQGCLDAIKSTPRLPVFAPTEAEDKAKTFGYADGTHAGEAARVGWWRKFHLLMGSNASTSSEVLPKTGLGKH